ncbi:MAG: hypothetical protein J6A89_03990 [Clostridia bacterium]|nr:hypothetical protein [Clostridia bacterium]
MSLHEKKLANKVRALKIFNKDLSKTKEEVGELLDKRTEEIQEEFFNILGNMKLLLSNKKYKELSEYIDIQYQILKGDLFENKIIELDASDKHI